MADTANSSSILGIDGLPHFYLVKSEGEHSEVLSKCEKLIVEYWGSKAPLTWLNELECLDMSTNKLSKTDVFIFPEFKGPAFDHLRQLKTALLLGPSVLSKCLVENETIPTAPPPWIFNTAMSGLVITLSGLKESDKKKYTDLISFMGGLCMNVLPASATHLVSNTVYSVKYEAAVQQKIPVMKTEWIDQVWNRNLEEFVSATDPQFASFKLPAFYNLNVSCTLLTPDEKSMVERLVTSNGGVFHRSFKPLVVQVLVVNANGTTSDKFRAACKHKKVCVLPKWIEDSAEAGCALPFTDYEVTPEVRVSTPNKDRAQNPEFSVSQIQPSGNTTVNESVVSVRSKNLSMISEFQAPVGTPPKKGSSADPNTITDNYYKESMKGLNVTLAKRAGCFLDGCNIFFSGFTPTEMGKLNKIVSLSGATRFDELNDSVTHVIIGKKEEKELKGFQDMNKGIFFLKFSWLKESLEAGHAVNEDNHCYELAPTTSKTVLLEQPSPASKRNIAAMNSSFKKPLPKSDQLNELCKKPKSSKNKDGDDEGEEFELPRNNLMNRYLQSTEGNVDSIDRNPLGEKGPGKENARTSTQLGVERPLASSTGIRGENLPNLLQQTFDSDLDTEDYENLNFFNGKKFAIQNMDKPEEFAQLVIDIQNFGGSIVEKGYKKPVEYIVTGTDPHVGFKQLYKAKEVVTNWWMEDVIAARSVVPIEYFHRVIHMAKEMILSGIVCVISTYTGAERLYLNKICVAMGAVVEDKYEKKKMPILICEKAEGSKYKGAVNWQFPVVTKEWILDNYNKACLYRMEDYLVGESKVVLPIHVELNEKGIPRGTEPPPPVVDVEDNDSSMYQALVSLPVLSQVPPTPQAERSKRKSDDTDTFVMNIEKKMRMQQDNLALLPNNSPNVNNRVKALRTESKSSNSPTTPISAHIREMGQEFGYDTPRRKALYDVLKETSNLTPATPHTPEVMKMPTEQLHPDPEATPGRQWTVLNKFGGILSQGKGRQGNSSAGGSKKKLSPETPLSEIKKRFWQQTLGEDYVYNNNSTMMNINSQLIQVEPRNNHNDSTVVESEEPVASTSTSKSPDQTVPQDKSAVLQGLQDFISKRKSEPKRPIENLETCPVVSSESEGKDPEMMVGWAEPDEVQPFKTPPSSKERRRTGNQSTPYFITSGLEVSAATVQMVQELHGDMQERKGDYESRATHIVCLKPCRVEKVLCAMAAGKWIVPLKYIEDSYGAKRFLDEELYEWANPKCTIGMESFTSTEKQVAQAAYSWRLRIQDKSSDKYRTGAFHGFKVLLWAKTQGFRNIIEAGGGICLEVGNVFRDSEQVARTATHCFVEKRLPFPDDNMRWCQESRVPVYDMQYLNEYMLNDNNSSKLMTFKLNGRSSTGAGS